MVQRRQFTNVRIRPEHPYFEPRLQKYRQFIPEGISRRLAANVSLRSKEGKGLLKAVRSEFRRWQALFPAGTPAYLPVPQLINQLYADIERRLRDKEEGIDQHLWKMIYPDE